MQCVLAFCCRLFGALRPNTNWKIECHQFRIEARSDAPGQPTPEGVHRDGVDYALVLLINRTNIKSGTTTVHDLDGHTLGSFTLTAPLDTAIVDDARVKHGVTAVEPIDPTRAAYRDVLVVTFKARIEISRLQARAELCATLDATLPCYHPPPPPPPPPPPLDPPPPPPLLPDSDPGAVDAELTVLSSAPNESVKPSVESDPHESVSPA